MSAQAKVVLLGTGTPVPDPHASGPATAVVLGARTFLFDAGPGVERQMAKANLAIHGPEAVFVTHLHSDHTLGYPDLIFTSWVMGRDATLSVFGPPGLKNMTDHIETAWSDDIEMRTGGLERLRRDALKVDVREIEPGFVHERDGVRIAAFEVHHGTWKMALGFRVDTPDRSIVISGDTRPCEELIRAASGCDVLVHEVYPAERVAPEDRLGGESWPEYMRCFHTSDEELGAIAARAQPNLLVLTHIIRMGATDEELLAGVRRGGFTGPVAVGHDLERY
jgi:ribonuclease Z